MAGMKRQCSNKQQKTIQKSKRHPVHKNGRTNKTIIIKNNTKENTLKIDNIDGNTTKKDKNKNPIKLSNYTNKTIKLDNNAESVMKKEYKSCDESSSSSSSSSDESEASGNDNSDDNDSDSDVEDDKEIKKTDSDNEELIPNEPRNLISVEKVWSHLPYSKLSEMVFNKQLSNTETKCAVCIYFSQRDADYLYGDSKKTEVSKDLTVGKLLVTELCFAECNSSEAESIDTAFNLMFGVEEDNEIELIMCSRCHVAVHNTCYGVEADSFSSTQWFCDKCTYLKSLTDEEYTITVQKVHCCLCNLRGGAVKPTTDGLWCHIVCAIAFPEVTFVDQKKRSPINICSLNPARLKLHCIYCFQSMKHLSGACIQCKVGKCATPFHITCSFHHGIPLYLGDWPVLIEAICPKHVKIKTTLKHDKREMGEVNLDDMVIAKHKNGRFYKGRVGDITMMLYYKVIFEDKSFCFDLPPQDIQDMDASETILNNGTMVKILWTDRLEYNAEVTGHWYEALCQVKFEDGSSLNVKRSDLYLEGEDVPKRVQSKISYASETANKFYSTSITKTTKRRACVQNKRKANKKL